MEIFLAVIVGLLWVAIGLTFATLFWMQALGVITLSDAAAIGLAGLVLGPIWVIVWAWHFLPTGPAWDEIVIWRRK
jgi:hypothetical protein